jgi:hypothetical protein
MMTVMLCGGDEDDVVSNAVVRALTEYGGVQYFTGKELAVRPEGKAPRFLLYNYASLPRHAGISGILVFKNSFEEHWEHNPHARLSASGLVPVLDAQNHKAAAVLKGTGKIAITCGMAARDTLSIASLEDNGAVVSLQRQLLTVTGELLEPHDFKIYLKQRLAVYPLLASCAVLLLAGVPSAEGYCF